jgi:hypothetical protein
MSSHRTVGRLVVALLLGSAIGAGPALAAFGDTTTASASFTADTLNAPTGLTVSSGLGLTANLSWTAVSETYAAGYRVFRSTTSGSGYTLVATVTPRTTTTASNTPLLPGRYYFIVRAFAGNWTSPASNEVSILLL